jgi:dipeptidyl aminopeptidase/acylaminoacyl peptidase
VDGEGFDLVRRSAESKFMHDEYKRIYADGAAALKAFSPMTHVAPPNAPAFLLLASHDHVDGVRESEFMAQALTSAGTAATFAALPDQRKGNLRTTFLAEQGGSGWAVMDFLQQTFAER